MSRDMHPLVGRDCGSDEGLNKESFPQVTLQPQYALSTTDGVLRAYAGPVQE